MAPAHHFVEVTCPDTGRQITVARRLDPVGQMFVTNQISQHQRAAAEAYQADLEAMAGDLRAPSRGPDDVSGWRGRRSGSNSKAAGRLKRAAKDLDADQLATIRSALTGRTTDGRKLHQALDKLAVSYGLSTVTRH